MLRWLWLSLLVVVLDQLSKYLVEAWLTPYQALALLPSLNFTLVYNTGAAFSFLADAGGWQRWFFLVLSLVIGVVLVVWLRRLRQGETATAVALALILGGALGNAIDRALYGHVVDFIDVYYRGWHWPAFNIADSAICVGAGLLMLTSLRQEHPSKSRQTG